MMEKSQNGQYFFHRNYKRSVGLRSAIEAKQFWVVPIKVPIRNVFSISAHSESLFQTMKFPSTSFLVSSSILFQILKIWTSLLPLSMAHIYGRPSHMDIGYNRISNYGSIKYYKLWYNDFNLHQMRLPWT